MGHTGDDYAKSCSPAVDQHWIVCRLDTTTHVTNDGKNAVKIVRDRMVGPRQTLKLYQLTHRRRVRKLHAQHHANTCITCITKHILFTLLLMLLLLKPGFHYPS